MNQILVNVIPFNEQPFKNPITLYEYLVKEETKWTLIGLSIRKIRRFLRNTDHLIFQKGRTVISTINLYEKPDLMQFLNIFEAYQEKTFSAKNEQERETLELLLGEAFSHSLRTSILNAYKIIEFPGAVYYATDPFEVSNFGELDVFKGFAFVPIIRVNGSAGILIDPRTKYHTKENLRNIKIDKNYELTLSHIDACPVHTCEEKKDPLSICKLSGTGTIINIVDFKDQLPSKSTKEGELEHIDLREYHDNIDICPRKYLKSYIQDLPPVAITEFGYPYPIERIRRSPRPYMVNNLKERNELHKLISLRPERRYAKTISYGKLLYELPVDNILELKSTGELLTENDISHYSAISGIMPRIKLALGSGESSYFVIKDFSTFGPYKKPERTETQVCILIIVGNHKNEDTFIHQIKRIFDKKEKQSNKELLNSKINFHKFTKVPIELLEIIKVENNDQSANEAVLNVINQNTENEINKFSVLIAIGDHNIQPLIVTKKLLIEEDMPNQGLNISTFLEKFEKQQESYFNNIMLGLFCKMGGVPWSYESQESNVLFIGYTKSLKDETKWYVLTLYDSRGIWQRGFYTKIKKENFESSFFSSLNIILEGRNESEIRFYTNGRLYDQNEYTTIVNTLRESEKEFTILEIVNHPIRIYNSTPNKIASIIRRGSFIEYLPNKIALVTTISPGQGSPQPLTIILKDGDFTDKKKFITEIFMLTNYVGYDKSIIRYPSPLHAARKIRQTATKFGIKSNFHFKTPLFI